MYRLLHFKSTEGKDLFAQWLDGLKDKQTKARIAARLIRLQNGNFGDCKPLREGVWEQRAYSGNTWTLIPETLGHHSGQHSNTIL